MCHLLLCLEQSELKDLIKAHFSPYNSVELIFTEEAPDVLNYINMFPDVRAVVSQSHIKQSEAAKHIDQMLSNQPNPYNFFVIGAFDKDLKNCKKQFKIEDYDQMILNLKKLLGIEENAPASESLSDFVSMPSHLFLHFTTLPFDLYLKIKTADSEKFVKRIPEGEAYSSELLEGYIAKGAKEFFFKKSHIKSFSKLLIEQLETRITQKNSGNGKEQLKVESEVFHSSKDIINSLGLKPKVVTICEQAIKNIHDRLKEEKNLKVYLDSLTSKDNLQYQYSFISITSFICSQILDQKELPRGKKDEYSLRLVFASFFSDISLSNEKFLACRSADDVLLLPKNEQDHVNKHALRSAEIIGNYPLIPSDVVKIVMQHHGTLNGVGFATIPAPAISPLSAILIVAQEFSSMILQTKGIQLPVILDQLSQKFNDTSCESAVKELISSFQKS